MSADFTQQTVFRKAILKLARMALAPVAVLTLAVPAVAGAQLSGQSVWADYLFPDYSVYQYGGPRTVDASKEYFFANNNVYADVGDQSLRITVIQAFVSFNNSYSFNGVHFFDWNNSLPDFQAIALDPSSAVSSSGGFDMSRVTSDADNIWVNMGGLVLNGYADDHVTLNLFQPLDEPGDDPETATPEPASLFLLATGFLAIAAASRRGRSRPPEALTPNLKR
ncbi:MAG: PEP-CTERM sorting domain-containing protein [Gemmatimonadota bacterium]